MALALWLLVGGLALCGTVAFARRLEADAWRSSLIAFRLRLPGNLSIDDVTRWLASISATTHPPRWSLLPMPPVGLEVVGTASGIEFRLLLSRRNQDALLSGLRASLPGVRLEEVDESPRPHFDVAAEATLSTQDRPLDTRRLKNTNVGLLAAMQPLSGAERICIQWIFTSAGTPPPVHTAEPGKEHSWSAYLLDGEVPADAEAVRALRLKRQEPLLRAVVRVGVSAQGRPRALRLFGRAWPHLHVPSVGVRIVRRYLPSQLVAGSMTRQALPLLRWPLLLNTSELAALLPLPVGGVQLPGLALHTARQLPPAPHMPTRGAVVGVSNWPGMTNRPLALKIEDRLRHVWVTAPTGAGKSTLLAQMALHDIRAGYGTVVIDPKNDLVDDILRRLPKDRVDDVTILEPRDIRQPTGFNILEAAQGEHARELVTDNVVGVFSELWKSSWGPRTSDVLRNTILTLTHAAAADGSAFTLCEVPELLTNPSFRRSVTEQSSVPTSVRGFWAQYEAMSDGERAQVIGPSLNKLRALTTRSSLRLMLGQSVGVDLGAVFRDRKILLVPLSKGVVGEDTARLLGALLIASLWQTALTRMAIPRERRRPVFCFIDEFADMVKLPLPLAEMLSQARGLGLSITLANQYAAQLPDNVKAAVLGTVRTQIAMQLEYEDAKVLEKRFVPLTTDDLTGLEAYEFAMRPAVGGRTLSPVTGTTLPLGPPLHDGREVAQRSRQRWGRPRAEVEAELRNRVGGGAGESPRIGRFDRKPLGDGGS